MKPAARWARFVPILLVWGLAAGSPAAATTNPDGHGPPASCDDATAPAGCTVITVSKGGRVLFGGNDDYNQPDSYYWVDPGDGGRYGAIWIGTPDNVQQGINERGLAYDANGLPPRDVNPHAERAEVSGGYTSYPIHILRECATVEEVVAWVGAHRWHSYMRDQMHFADAGGDAVILSAGPDGEVAFTRKPAGDGFLVSTNFNVAHPANGFGYPCRRYTRAREMLGRLLEREGGLTVEDAAAVLDGVHEETVSGWTIESIVADLSRGRVYVYYFHQFDRPVVLDVAEELADPRAPGPLSALFPEEVREEAARRYRGLLARSASCWRLGVGWLLAVLVSTLLLVPLVVRRGRGARLWVPAVILLGPVALLAWLLAGPGREAGDGRAALAEAVGGVMSAVPAYVAMPVALVLAPVLQGAWQAHVVLLLVVPVLLGWLVFQGLLLVPAARGGAGLSLIRRLPQAWIAANLGMAGISVAAIPLVQRSLRICPAPPLSGWTVVTWWAVAVLGTLPGAAFLFLYERWAVGRGFRAWSALAGGAGEAGTPPWRRLWWWIPLSYVALAAGIAAGALLQSL